MRNLKHLAIVFIFIFTATILFAQEEEAPKKEEPKKDASAPTTIDKKTNPASEYSEADRPEENYLARFHALEKCEFLIKRNLDKIFTLNVITTNFKKQHSDWEADYKKIYQGYKDGVDLYYRRNVIYSRVKLEANHVAINEFNKKIATTFKKECLDMLNLCADNILELTLDARTSADPNKNRVLFNNKMRIRVAYGQLDDGERAEMDRVFHTAVSHYRVCKTYAIKILETLNPQQYKGKFDLHKADNRNRILTERKTTAPEAAIVE